MGNTLSAKVRIHLSAEDKCFGPGICTLLEEVEKTGSLRKAAMNMNMAYSKAWKIVKMCEENLGVKLLISTAGGKNGGGAVLTDEARQFIAAYRQLCRRTDEFVSEVLNEEFGFYING